MLISDSNLNCFDINHTLNKKKKKKKKKKKTFNLTTIVALTQTVNFPLSTNFYHNLYIYL